MAEDDRGAVTKTPMTNGAPVPVKGVGKHRKRFVHDDDLIDLGRDDCSIDHSDVPTIIPRLYPFHPSNLPRTDPIRPDLY